MIAVSFTYVIVFRPTALEGPGIAGYPLHVLIKSSIRIRKGGALSGHSIHAGAKLNVCFPGVAKRPTIMTVCNDRRYKTRLLDPFRHHNIKVKVKFSYTVQLMNLPLIEVG